MSLLLLLLFAGLPAHYVPNTGINNNNIGTGSIILGKEDIIYLRTYVQMTCRNVASGDDVEQECLLFIYCCLLFSSR